MAKAKIKFLIFPLHKCSGTIYKISQIISISFNQQFRQFLFSIFYILFSKACSDIFYILSSIFYFLKPVQTVSIFYFLYSIFCFLKPCNCLPFYISRFAVSRLNNQRNQFNQWFRQWLPFHEITISVEQFFLFNGILLI